MRSINRRRLAKSASSDMPAPPRRAFPSRDVSSSANSTTCTTSSTTRASARMSTSDATCRLASARVDRRETEVIARRRRPGGSDVRRQLGFHRTGSPRKPSGEGRSSLRASTRRERVYAVHEPQESPRLYSNLKSRCGSRANATFGGRAPRGLERVAAPESSAVSVERTGAGRRRR